MKRRLQSLCRRSPVDPRVGSHSQSCSFGGCRSHLFRADQRSRAMSRRHHQAIFTAATAASANVASRSGVFMGPDGSAGRAARSRRRGRACWQWEHGAQRTKGVSIMAIRSVLALSLLCLLPALARADMDVKEADGSTETVNTTVDGDGDHTTQHVITNGTTSTALGTSSAPIRTDPTGSTAQPVTDNGGSLTVDGTVAVSGVATQATLASTLTELQTLVSSIAAINAKRNQPAGARK